MSKVNADLERRALADLILSRALELMEEQGIPFEVIIDRLLTCAAAHMTGAGGSAEASAMFRVAARNIDAGDLASLEAKNLHH